MSDEAYTLNVKGLEQLAKALKRKPPVTRLGILGSYVSRVPEKGEKKTLTNAEIGALYEYEGGVGNRPGGSFLRVPVADKLAKAMEVSGALTEETTKKVIASGSMVPWMEKVAKIAEAIVAGAFASGGYGKWKPSNMSRKDNHQTLVETTQLRESISSDVSE